MKFSFHRFVHKLHEFRAMVNINDILYKCVFFNVSNAPPYIIYKIEMKYKTYDINFIVAT